MKATPIAAAPTIPNETVLTELKAPALPVEAGEEADEVDVDDVSLDREDREVLQSSMTKGQPLSELLGSIEVVASSEGSLAGVSVCGVRDPVITAVAGLELVKETYMVWDAVSFLKPERYLGE